MNSYLASNDRAKTTAYQVPFKLAELVRPAPSGTFVFLDEREDTVDNAMFAIPYEGLDPPVPPQTWGPELPASYHNRAGSLSFADGHSETHRWTDPRTIPPLKPTITNKGFTCPNNRDVLWLWERSTRRK